MEELAGMNENIIERTNEDLDDNHEYIIYNEGPQSPCIHARDTNIYQPKFPSPSHDVS